MNGLGPFSKLIRRIYSPEDISRLQLDKAIEKETAEREHYIFEELPGRLIEGSPYDVAIRLLGWDITDDEIKKLLEHKYATRAMYLICLIRNLTQIGIVLKPEFVKKIKNLSAYENEELQSTLELNQDLETYVEETNKHIAMDSHRYAYYYIRNHPLFNEYKDKIITLCMNIGKKYKKDITITNSETAYATIVIMCDQKKFTLDNLELIASKLEKPGLKLWAEIAYALAGNTAKAKELIERK